MTTYEIEFRASAKKELGKLPKNIYIRVLKSLQKLTTDPRGSSCKKLVGSELWRLRVGDYRVVYEIVDSKLIVTIIRVSHRKDVYR